MSRFAVRVAEMSRKGFVAVGSRFWSCRAMGVVAVVSAIGVFVPPGWWKACGLERCRVFCLKFWGWLWVAFVSSLAICLGLLVSAGIRRLARRRQVRVWMQALTHPEVQALCNAYHHQGQASLDGKSPELAALKEHGLIVMAEESWGFGEYDYRLAREVVAYLRRNGNYFASHGVVPQQMQEHVSLLSAPDESRPQ